jgi:site-specific recombinase XerD
MDKSDKPILKHIPDFLDYCEVEKGLASKTQENYKHYLDKFALWLRKAQKQDIKPHELTSEDVWAYRLYLSRFQDNKGRPLKKTTQNYYLIALRALLGYFVQKDVQSLPPGKITLPKDARAEKTVKFLNLDQVERLLLAPDTKDIAGLRDRAILESLFSTGLRIAELVALNKEQFVNLKDKKDLEIGIIGKGSHPRTVYFSERALEWIKKYLDTRKDKEKALFIHYKARKDAQESRLTSRSIERLVKKYAILGGVPIFTTPHTLRHSYATDLLTQGVDLRTVQEFLGHRSILTTQIYTHITNKRLRDIHKQFHSGKNLKES